MLLDEPSHDVEESEGIASFGLDALVSTYLKPLSESDQFLIGCNFAGRKPFENRAKLVFHLGEFPIKRLDLFRGMRSRLFGGLGRRSC